MTVSSPPTLEEVLARFEQAWRSGLNPRAEEWIGQLDSSRHDEVSELIYLEFCLAEEDHRSPQPDDYLRRFPAQSECLSKVFGLHHLVTGAEKTQADLADTLPQVGDSIGSYTFIRKLGQGSFAVVFLAREHDLSGRLVVIKVTSRPTLEANFLARARHSHIVEVLRTGETPGGEFQLIVMPFLGGETLLEVARAIRRQARPPTTGRGLLARLDEVAAPEFPFAKLPRPACEILQSLSYPKAIAWIFARLAEALCHAAEQGVMHGDIKPSNILLTADGMPMLFDFNLASDGLASGELDGGGTPAYMPPERLRAIHIARSSAQSKVAPIDLHRADLYALGLVLVELLTGRSPFVVRGTPLEQAEARSQTGVSVYPDWRRLAIPATLRPILQRCLAADPANRYADGRELAADLDRWRLDLPPMHAPDALPAARLGRWISRRRVMVAAATLSLCAAIGASAVLSAKFKTTRKAGNEEHYSRFIDKWQMDLFDLESGGVWVQRGDPIARAKKPLDVYHVRDDLNWRERTEFSDLSQSHRDDLELLMLEQVYRLASAYLERPNSPGDWQEALDLVEREYRHVPATAFDRLRKALYSKLDRADAAAKIPKNLASPPAWLEFYLLGVEAEPDHARKAHAHFARAYELRGDLLWPRVRFAAAASRIADITNAVDSLGEAVAHRPVNPVLTKDYAAALFSAGRFDEAARRYTQAVAIDPDLASAHHGRSFAEYAEGKWEQSEASAGRYGVIMNTPAATLKVQLGQLIWYSRMKADSASTESAREELDRRLKRIDPSSDSYVRIEDARRIGIAGQERQAIEELDAILELEPRNLHAAFLRMCFVRRLKGAAALGETLALINHPRFEEFIPLHPDATRFFYGASGDHLGQGDRRQAIEVARRGLKAARLYRRLEEEQEFALGRALASDISIAQTDEIAEAKTLIQHAVETNPEILMWYRDSPYLAGFRAKYPEFLKEPD